MHRTPVTTNRFRANGPPFQFRNRNFFEKKDWRAPGTKAI
ncbi:hypothetical protein FTUN_2003 [Frigoriglobus tundricola]|uniref:Uncharacterized protein n=1 Tax=Frigoriglobus tundricola TaxID=2774151 RepID=A0A6M5YND8_9BACT|nr:hypothetical protein FTUN_2003 [Frigoriglobus tundricola]